MMPLFDARSDVELFAILAGSKDVSAYDLVRATLRTSLLESHGLSNCGASEGSKIVCATGAYPVLAFEHDWKKALRDGIVGGSGAEPADLSLRVETVTKALAGGVASHSPSRDGLEVVFAVDAKMLDGRHANNSWLQELSDPVTQIAWDNAALVSPVTAKELGIESGDVIRLSLGGRSILVAACVLPGTAERSIALSLGWGRTRAGRIGNGRGFDVYPLRAMGAMHFAGGVSVAKTGKRYELARTQRHTSEEGRPLAREATLAEYSAKPHFAELQSPPKRSLPLWTDVDYGKGHQWGMSIDLNACTGCNACVVACQAENNIPVVGKEQVALGRDMQWIRLDHYITDGEDPAVAIQPVACVQCEEAPCENVCPVAALEHSAEGLSEITYNRCIGTRYCANNCPYKVRKFNYLNWHNDGVWKETGGLPETLQMQQNPNVTVRFRGVVEKCTYCVQRIQSQRFVAKREGRDLRDGDVVTACQATCPAEAIVFGDLNDMSSRVAKLTVSDRRYGLLEELGTKPRTTYLAKVRNPNPEMAR
jgi:molybdopterin-containing oxidoreductase family iron-sulfur binding subunit